MKNKYEENPEPKRQYEKKYIYIYEENPEPKKENGKKSIKKKCLNKVESFVSK